MQGNTTVNPAIRVRWIASIGIAAFSLTALSVSAHHSFAGEAGIRDREAFARKWHILMKGSIVSAAEGDRDAAARAREMGALVLDDALARAAKQTS